MQPTPSQGPPASDAVGPGVSAGAKEDAGGDGVVVGAGAAGGVGAGDAAVVGAGVGVGVGDAAAVGARVGGGVEAALGPGVGVVVGDGIAVGVAGADATAAGESPSRSTVPSRATSAATTTATASAVTPATTHTSGRPTDQRQPPLGSMEPMIGHRGVEVPHAARRASGCCRGGRAARAGAAPTPPRGRSRGRPENILARVSQRHRTLDSDITQVALPRATPVLVAPSMVRSLELCSRPALCSCCG